jgi:hypothetical protein
VLKRDKSIKKKVFIIIIEYEKNKDEKKLHK